MIDFLNKTAIITGGTRGIGRSIADLLSNNGCYTIITGTKPKNESGVISKNLCYFQVDFNKIKTVKIFLKKIVKFKNIDILVNNAGINIIDPIDKINLADWRQVLNINLTGPLLLIKNVSLMMKKRKYGRILNVSSIFGLISKNNRGSYSTSKAGLIGLTRAAALDLAPYNILVNAICPGFTDTKLTRSTLSPKERKELSLKVPLKRFASVSEIATVAAFLCSDKNTYMTGQTLTVDGGFSIR